MARKSSYGIALAFAAAALVLSFQNCSQTTFTSVDLKNLSKNSVATYSTKEDTALMADLVRDRHTLSSQTSLPSTFSVTQQPSHGTLNFDTSKATFTYTPEANFYGGDQFVVAELQEGATTALSRSVMIKVESIDDLPVIKTDSLSFDMNSSNNPVILVLEDIDDPTVLAGLSSDGARQSLTTTNGLLEIKNGQIYYTPNPLYRGVEQVDFFAIDTSGDFSKKTISLVVGNPFRDFKPALAIRGSGCVACHANVQSPFVTDLGFGNNWFAATNSPVSHQNSATKLSFKSGNMYGDHADNWSTAKIAGPIVVPKTNAVNVGGATNMTLAQYFTDVESKKAAPASIKELNTVYIGAPTVAQLEARFSVTSSMNSKYLPNEASSTALSGLSYQSAGYFKNTGTVACDGDVFLRGTVFLDKPVIKTKNGCRIHATGPIFLQENPTYENLGSLISANNTNLQLVSARAIILGVGLTHCETGTQWYATNTSYPNPLSTRLRDIWTSNSHVSRTATDARAEGTLLLAEAGKLSGYKDASCYAGGRSVNLERILLNAPMVQSRLTGNVSGVVIAEAALFALNQFAYKFDDVFSRVPVLPLLQETDFLVVK